jgi:Fe2+ or Zn2+ uptake regulation protein
MVNQLQRPSLLDAPVEKGVRMTRQRRALIEVIQESKQHLDAGDLLDQARRREPNLNRTTVYRT